MATSPVPNPLEELDIAALRRRSSLKWRTHPADVLPLWVAEMDVMPAEPVRKALHEAVSMGDTGYPSGGAYAEALGHFASRRWNWRDVSAKNSAIVPDVMLGIVEVLRLVTKPGDTVVVNAPVYPPFYAFTSHDDRRVTEASLTPEGRIDPATLERAFAEATRDGKSAAFLMSNPHNPTGAVHRREELEQVAALANRYGVRVVSDEIHAPLILPGAEFTPFLSVAGSETGFSVMSASKAWNLAGLKAALVIAGSAAQADLDRMPEEVSHGPSHLGIIAHSAALTEGEPWLDALLVGLDENRALLKELVADKLPQASWTPPEGTYLAWLDFRSLGLHEDADLDGPGVVSDLSGPAKFFLDEARVALSSGHVFGSGGAGHVRLNFATSQAILSEAIERMAAALKVRG